MTNTSFNLANGIFLPFSPEATGVGVPGQFTTWSTDNAIGPAGTPSGALLDQLTGFSSTGILQRTGAGAYSFLTPFIGNNATPLTADGSQVVVQNSALAQATMFNPVTGGVVYDGVRSTVYIPAGSTSLSGNGFGAYIRNRSGSGSAAGAGVLFYGLATAGASNTSVWGANYRFQDSEDTSGHSYTGVQLIGSEMDYLVKSAATVIEGHSIIYASTVSFAGGNGFQVSNSTPTFGQLTNSFVSGDAAAACALFVGSVVGTGTSGVGGSSQSIKFNWWNTATPSVEKVSTLAVDNGGQLTWPGNIALTAAAATQVLLSFGAGSPKWQLGSLANGHLFAFDLTGSAFVWQMTSGGTFAFTPTVTVPSLLVGSNQVVGARDTGWTAMTGSADKATTYATSSVTLAQLAGRVMQLQAALTTHGLLGA